MYTLQLGVLATYVHMHTYHMSVYVLYKLYASFAIMIQHQQHYPWPVIPSTMVRNPCITYDGGDFVLPSRWSASASIHYYGIAKIVSYATFPQLPVAVEYLNIQHPDC